MRMKCNDFTTEQTCQLHVTRATSYCMGNTRLVYLSCPALNYLHVLDYICIY